MNVVVAPLPAHIATLPLIGTHAFEEPARPESQYPQPAHLVPLAQNLLASHRNVTGPGLITDTCQSAAMVLAPMPSALAEYIAPDDPFGGLILRAVQLPPLFVSIIGSITLAYQALPHSIYRPQFFLLFGFCWYLAFGLLSKVKGSLERMSVPELLEVLKRRANAGEIGAIRTLVAAHEEGAISADDPDTRAFTPDKLSAQVLIEYELRRRREKLDMSIAGRAYDAASDPVREYIQKRALTDQAFNGQLNQALQEAGLPTIPFLHTFR